jgi:hypothetical protein
MPSNLLRLSTISRVLVLCCVIFGQNYLHAELFALLVLLLGLILIALGKIQRSYFKLIWPLLAVLLTGLIGILSHDTRDILRDIAYAITPLVLIFAGYWIAGIRDMWPLVLKVVVVSGFVVAVVHLTKFVPNPELLLANSLEVRETVGGTGDIVVFSFLLGVFHRYFGIHDLFPKLLPSMIVLPVLLASFVLSYSRTEFLVAIILTLTLLGLVSRVGRFFVLASVIIAVGYITISVATPKDEEGTFRSRLLRSAKEITMVDYLDMADINSNWRGFESYRVWDSFVSGNIQQQIFGKGFGAVVDLGFEMPLGGEYIRYIPIFHNGYAYILLKVGIFGLAFYMIFYVKVVKYAMRHSNSLNKEPMFMSRLLLGCVLSLISVMYVLGGMAEMHQSEFVILLGYLVRRLGFFEEGESNFGRIGINR